MRTAPVRGPASWLALALIALAPLSARGAGVEIPDNGALPIARGGTAVSMFGNAYSLEFNPAAMATVDGLDVRLDMRDIDNTVTFQRGPAGDGSVFDKVSNSAGGDIEPSLQVAYRLRHILQGRLAFGLGIWGPPGVLHYKYPSPLNEPKEEGWHQVDAQTPQRYSLIDSYMLIIYPSVGVAFRITHQLAVGLTLQDVVANIDFHQAIGLYVPGITQPGQEDTDFDAIAHLSVHQSYGLTGILGVAYMPIPKLHLGLSFRPQIVIKADGTLNVQLPKTATSMGEQMQGNSATFEFALPPVAHLGATYLFSDRLNVSAEAVWEGWSVVKSQSLQPHDIAVTGPIPAAVSPISIPRHWMDSYSGRIGATYTVLEWAQHDPLLDVSAGALFETSAVPSSYQAVDFVNGNRYAGGLGLTFHWHHFALTASGMYYPEVDVDISDSKVARTTAPPEPQPLIVGNGTYTTSSWIAAVGLAYSGLGG